jgi:hypothetical protein
LREEGVVIIPKSDSTSAAELKEKGWGKGSGHHFNYI